jgi:anthranilate synthase/indole-3-glycerol phosphate synthase/phosphoribosylanthranilate isomerase
VTQPTILDTIVERRREDVAASKRGISPASLQGMLTEMDDLPPRDFVSRLRQDAPMAVIAEIKRASPSRGDIAPDIKAAEQALVYAKAGASGISVLTEPHWFKGDREDLCEARDTVGVLGDARPGILCKDFIIDEYQVVMARVWGADSVLLIVACLDDALLRDLMAVSRGLGMEPLVEVNNAREMERALAAGATFIGVNNRDLRDFSVDLGTTDRLAGMATEGILLAALSGINERADVERFQRAGAQAVLVGESLMRAEDPAAKIRELAGR